MGISLIEYSCWCSIQGHAVSI